MYNQLSSPIHASTLSIFLTAESFTTYPLSFVSAEIPVTSNFFTEVVNTEVHPERSIEAKIISQAEDPGLFTNATDKTYTFLIRMISLVLPISKRQCECQDMCQIILFSSAENPIWEKRADHTHILQIQWKIHTQRIFFGKIMRVSRAPAMSLIHRTCGIVTWEVLRLRHQVYTLIVPWRLEADSFLKR